MNAEVSTWKIEPDYVDAHGRSRAVDANVLDRLRLALQDKSSGTGDGRPRGIIVRRGQRNDTGTAAVPDSGVLDAPASAFQPEIFRNGSRLWLLMVQLYAVRSTHNWGHGDFTDLAQLVHIASAAGAAGVGLNPLHALPPGQASPYSPSSRRFLNPLYIDVEAVPEFPGAGAGGLSAEIARLKDSETIDYHSAGRVKRRALTAAFDRFRRQGDPARQHRFEQFCRHEGAALEQHAAFEMLTARHGWPWTQWPEAWRYPQSIAGLRETDDAAITFECYVQWLAHEQLSACRDLTHTLGLPVGLYLDIAVGVDPAGSDAWRAPEQFTRGLSVGAPPDIYNMRGQDWGLAAFHPQALIEHDFTALREMLRAAMRYAGAIRIDHALGLNRLYLIPQGYGAADGGYVSYPFQAMLAVTAQESAAARCLVIGEDLGTIPEGVCEALADWGIWSYRVGLFERMANDRFRAPEDFPENAIVTFNTHDLPSFAGWLSRHDLALRAALGLDSFEDAGERSNAQSALQATLAQFGMDSELTFANVLRYLARTRCKLLAVALEDVLELTDQPNIPGTIDEHPNWRRRLPVTLDDLASHPALRRLSDVLAQEGRNAATGG